jgi:S-DNA-T family DNA segregation ATPase FtsK/SpoIIIE
MIGTAIGMLSIALGGLNMFEKKNDTKELVNKWNNIMLNCGNKNENEMGQRFELLKVIPKHYGFDCIVSIPDGKSFEELEQLKPIIQANLRCINVIFDWKKSQGCIYARLITVPFDMDKEYEPVKAKPYEIYLGGTDYYKDVISDMRLHPHILISGVNGSGKSVLMFIMLLNLIISNKQEDVSIYLLQLGDKQDLRVFGKCNQVKYYGRTLEDAVKVLAHLFDEMSRRNKLINEHITVNNIYEYNKKFPYNKMNYIYVFADEFSLYMEDDLDTPQESFLKNKCQSYLKSLIKLARSAGIYVVTGLQRPDKENMLPIFKSQLNTRIAFRQNNGASSLVVVDNYDALDLENRECITLFGGERNKVITPYCSMELIQRYIAEYEDEETNYVDLSKYNHIIAESKKAKKENKENKKPKKENDNKSNVRELPLNNDVKKTSKGRKGVM